MKTKEYILKYKLNESDKFSHPEFISDLTSEFISLLEVGKGTSSFKGYENAVRAIRMKWDAINNKTVGQIPDKLWNYFYATVIAKTKEELFPEQLAKIREENERMARIRGERRQQQQSYDDFFWAFLFRGMPKFNSKPIESYNCLGLSVDASEDDIKKRYRELSLIHHPDKGGSSEKFLEITEAKNKILASLTLYKMATVKKSKKDPMIISRENFGTGKTYKNPDPIKKILTKLKPVKLSVLYKKINENTLTDNDRLLLAQILKQLATKPTKDNGIVYGKDHFVDLNKREPITKF